MNFLNPFILFGLFAASIPVLLHLLNLRKLKTVEFSTLRFIKELQKTKIRKLKLKQIILLILRTLIIIFAVLAFARPTIQGRLPFIESYAKTSAVILIDNSFSIDVSDERGNRLKQSKQAAKEIISALKDGDEIAILETANIKNREQYSFTRNFDLINEAIDKITIRNNKSNLETSLKLASQMLENAKNINKELFVISDFQTNVLDKNSDSTKIFAEDIGLYILPIGMDSKADIQNLSIDSINVISKIFQINRLVEAEVSIRNNGKSTASAVVISMQFNNQKVAQRSLDIPAGEVRTISIAANATTTGAISATVQLESDALDIDNTASYGFIIPETPKIAIVGNDNQRKFASSLLKTVLVNDYNTNIKEVNSGTFSSIDLNSMDVVLIFDDINNSDLLRLNQYVANGGSAFIFANDLNPVNLNTTLNKFGFGNSEERIYKTNLPARISEIDKMHPLFEGVFLGETESKKNIESPEILKAYPVKSGQGIIKMNDGNFLAESRIGQGKVLYCAVSPVLNWSNLPISSLFPVLIYRGITYLTATESSSMMAILGTPITLNIPKKYKNIDNLKIVDPKGNEFFKSPAILPSGALLQLDDLEMPGVYNIYNANNKIVSQVSVNLLNTESVLTPIIKDDLVKYLKDKSVVDISPEFIEDYTTVNKSIKRSRSGTELWQLFLILALVCAVAEMIVQKASKNDLE